MQKNSGRILHKLAAVLRRPLEQEPLLFSLLCGAGALVMFSVVLSGATGLGTLVANIFVAYALTLLVSLLPKYLDTILRWIIVAYSLLMALMNFFGSLFIYTPSAMNTLMLVLQTNPEETAEFFSHYVSVRAVLMTLVALAFASTAAFVVYRLLRRPIVTKLALAGCLLTIPVLACLPLNVLQTAPQLEPCFTDLDLVFNHHDLRDYAEAPQINELRPQHPHNIVLIIGESHHRSHSSLISYAKATNPRLEKRRDKGNLIVMDSVTSPGTYTGQVLRRVLTTYNSSNRESNWWEHQTIPAIFKAAGYRTIWISNQKESGTRDAIADSFAQLCDSCIRTPRGRQYDGALLPLVKTACDEYKARPCFYFIHLMGSHEDYSCRYPEDFAQFRASDYCDCPENQRVTLAHYDNSLLYNDYIIDSIIQTFEDEATLAVYFPDHAIDLFMTDPAYAGHAKEDMQSRKVSSEIPLYIFLSSKLQQQMPDLYDTISSRRHHPFNTEYIPEMLLSLAGYGVGE